MHNPDYGFIGLHRQGMFLEEDVQICMHIMPTTVSMVLVMHRGKKEANVTGKSRNDIPK